MKTYFECVAQYTRVDESTGREKKVNETYLIDAVSYGEAEERINDELRWITSGECRVKRISPANYSEVIGVEGGDRYYKARVQTTLIDEACGSAKKVVTTSLVCASTVEDATACVHKAWENCTIDYTILAVVESKIVEVMLYDESEYPEQKGFSNDDKREHVLEACRKFVDKALSCNEADA